MEIKKVFIKNDKWTTYKTIPKWDGHAAERIVAIIANLYEC